MPERCPRCRVGVASGTPDEADALVSPDLADRVERGERIAEVVRSQAVYLGEVAKPIYFSPETALEWNVPLGKIPVTERGLPLLLRCVPVCARCFLALLPLALREAVGVEIRAYRGRPGA